MKNAPFLWVIKAIKKRIPALLIMTAAHIGNALFGIWFALGSRQVINTAVTGDWDAFTRACILQGGIILGTLLTVTLYRYLHATLEAELDRDWKKRLLHALLRADYPAVSAYHTGELLNRLNNDVKAVSDGILNALPDFAAMVTRVVGALVALIALEPRFTLLLMGAGAVLLLLTGIARQWLKHLHKQVSQAEGKVTAILKETLEKLLLVQAMDLSGEMERRSGRVLTERFALQRRRRNVTLVANTAVAVLYYLAGFGALVWCAAAMLRGQMLFGDLTAITQLVTQIQAPLVNLSGILPKYAAMLASAERLMELDALEQPEEQMLPRERYRELETLEAEDLTFAYDRDEVLSGLSFRLEKGSFTVVTGHSGRGKSTLLKLMLGIFQPGSGGLYLNAGGERLPMARQTRRLFAYVPQGNLIFSGTIRENLLIAAPEADAAAIARATFVSAMDEYLEKLPQGLDTVLGEDGMGLSEGQSQRLAIARAVLGGAPILLLDEATSALDEETERRVLERIRALPGRTCIAVTHRSAALELADTHLELL